MRPTQFVSLAILSAASTASAADSIYRDVNPDRLSGGLYVALEDAGVFPSHREPARARASYPDLSKGRAPAVLEPRVGLNIRLGDDPDALPANQRGQVEPHIVRSPANPDTLLATFQEGRYFDAGGISCGYAVSHDGGLTWRRALTPGLTTVTGGRFNRATDPVAGAGPQGDLYLQALASVEGAFSRAAVVVSRSTDNGVTWSPPFTVFESNTGLLGPDKNWLAVNDSATAPNSGRLVSTWTNFVRNAAGQNVASPLVASLSDDRGSTWSTPVEITPAGSNNQATQPLFLPDGSLVVIYITFLDANNVATFSIRCKRSADGGRTFPGAESTVVPVVNGWDDPELRDGVFLPSAAVARTTGELFVTYTAVVAGTPRIMVTRSTDQGNTWTAPLAVSDQPAGISVMNPVIASDIGGGMLAVLFTDKRHAPSGSGFVDHYVALYGSQVGGWQPNVRLSNLSSEIRFGPATARGVMLGDYLGLAAGDQTRPCVAIWSDTRTGDADPFVARFTPFRPISGSGQRVLPYSDWTTAHFSGSGIASALTEHDADADGDGATNLAEFALGTDPRTREYGDAIVLTRRATDRTEASIAVARNFSGFRATHLASDASASISTAAAPTSPALRPGLRWATSDIHHAAGEPMDVRAEFEERFIRFAVVTTLRSDGPDTPTSLTNSRLVNLSTRGRVGTGASQMIVGFVVDGPKSLLVRAAGPALSALGLANTLPDPRLTLQALASDFERMNDNWQQGSATSALFTRLGALPFANNALDAALALEAGAQSYTALATDTAGRSGIALIEAYDADASPGAPDRPRLLNLSTRGDAGSGENALIAGFVLSGTQPRRVLLRAVGPSLAQFNLSGTLGDPILTLYRGDTAIATNDDWELSRSAAAVSLTAQRVGAFPLNPSSLDAALLITLPPGPYTAIVSSADGSVGLALIEIYDAD